MYNDVKYHLEVNMTNNYLKKLIKYMKRVYKIENQLKELTDGRINPTYSTSEVILPTLLGFIFRIQNFNELKFKLKSKDFKSVVSPRMKLPR